MSGIKRYGDDLDHITEFEQLNRFEEDLMKQNDSQKCRNNCGELSVDFTKDDYMKFHQEMCEKMMAVTRAKNADYTGDSTDPFANFTVVEKLGITSTEQGFLTRMMDKIQRINSFVQKGELQVKDEAVEDTLMDLANYAILFCGYLKSKKDAPKVGSILPQKDGLTKEAPNERSS